MTTDGKALLLYDGDCPLCNKSVRYLQRLDWLSRMRYESARDPGKIPATNPPLDPERLLEEMHLVTPDGQRVYHGFRAFRWMAWRLPLVCWLTPLLYIPGVPWLGQKAYLWVARNRYQLVPCKDGVCEIKKGTGTFLSRPAE